MHRLIIVAVLFMLPLSAFAQVGFAKSSLWLGKTDSVVGEAVSLYASLSNTSAEKLSGEVVFFDGDDELGVNALALASGEGRIVSVSWKPETAGTHTLRAVMRANGEEVDRVTIATVVSEPPAAQAAAVVEGSEGIQKTIAEYSPQVSETLNPVFVKIDDLRESGASFLDRQIEGATQSLTDIKAKKENLPQTPGSVSYVEGKKLTASLIFSTLLLYVLSVLRFAVGNAALFYPLFAGMVLVGLYKLFRRLRDPGGWASDI